MMTNRLTVTNTVTWPLWAFLFAYIAVFYFYIFETAANIPTWDDLFMLEWLVRFRKAGSMGEKLSLLFEQHAEHVLFFGRIYTLLIFSITKPFSIYLFTVTHGLFLLLIPYTFYLYIRKEKLDYRHLIIPVLLLFSLHYYQAVLMMGCFNHTLLYSLGMVIIYLLSFHTDSKALYGAMIISFALLFSNTGAVCLLLTGLIVLCLKRDWSGVRKWSVYLVLVLAVFFSVYRKPEWTPSFSFGKLIENYEVYVKGFFGLIGGVFSFLGNPDARYFAGSESFGFPFAFSVPALLAGIVIFGTLVFSVCRIMLKYIKTNSLTSGNLFLIGLACFLGGLVLSAVLFRLENAGSLPALFVSRYKLLSISLLICAYFLVIKNLKVQQQRYFFVPVMFISLGLGIMGYIEYLIPSQNYVKSQFASVMSWRLGYKTPAYYPEGIVSQTAYRYWNELIDNDVYKLPNTDEILTKEFLEAQKRPLALSGGWQIEEQPDNHFVLKNRLEPAKVTTGSKGMYVVTWNRKDGAWEWLVLSRYRNPLTQLIKQRKLLSPEVKLKLMNQRLENIDLTRTFLVEVGNEKLSVSRIQFV